MLLFIYLLPLLFVTLCCFAVCLIWAVLNYKYVTVKKNGRGTNIWLIFNLICFCVMCFLIIYNTLIVRSGNIYKVELIPFYSFVVAKTQREMIRQLYMNVIMFLPFGMFLSCALSHKFKAGVTVFVSSVAGALLSLIIELSQYFFHLGEAWTDDVICNALGAFLGALVIVVPKLFKKKK